MGIRVGFRMESDKYIYFYKKKEGCSEPYVWNVIDKTTKIDLPFYIKDDLNNVYWNDNCDFRFGYYLDELTDDEMDDYNNLAKKAYDILKDYLLSEKYNQYEVNCYGKHGYELDYDKFISNVMKPCGGYKDKEDDEVDS